MRKVQAQIMHQMLIYYITTCFKVMGEILIINFGSNVIWLSSFKIILFNMFNLYLRKHQLPQIQTPACSHSRAVSVDPGSRSTPVPTCPLGNQASGPFLQTQAPCRPLRMQAPNPHQWTQAVGSPQWTLMTDQPLQTQAAGLFVTQCISSPVHGF